MADIQRNRWLLTINHPSENGLDHKTIKKILFDAFSTIQYIAMVDEEGSTYHTHLFLYFHSRVRFSTLKKHFPTAHIEAARGSTSDCIGYLKKDGKWLDHKEKQEQKIEGTFEEWGEKPPEKGNKAPLQELYQMVKDGYSNAEILAENQDYIMVLDKIDRLRTTLLQDKYKNERRTDLKVIYVSGPTGVGKTRGILDRHGDGNVYRVNQYRHYPFDLYDCQPVLLLDEFRSQLSISDMLQFLDIYPVILPARYSHRIACYHYVYIVSNWDLEAQYADEQQYDRESWLAFLRRIHDVQVYQKDGSIRRYSSMKEYQTEKQWGMHLTTVDEVGPFEPEEEEERQEKKEEPKNEEERQERMSELPGAG